MAPDARETLRIFIGFDPREAIAYHVCCQSILTNTKARIAFTPVRGGERRDGSNDFVYSRFLVPWLCDFNGFALFLDGDMVVRGDVADLFAEARLDRAAQVVKHDYKTKHPIKYLGNKNVDYPRKNWSSVVLWNCGHYGNRCLTPEYIAQHNGAHLHRFEWLPDWRIGDLPESWNRLVLEQPLRDDDHLWHYTIGTPCFSEYADCDGAEAWHNTLAQALEPIKR